MNQYLVNGTTFQVVLWFDITVLNDGDAKAKCICFFGSDWFIKTSKFLMTFTINMKLLTYISLVHFMV